MPEKDHPHGRKLFHLYRRNVCVIGRMVARNVVEVSAGLRLGRRLVRRSVCGRGYSKHVSKCPREGFVGLESGFERGLSYGFVGELQVSRGTL